MLTRLTIENFRAISRLEMDVGGLTVLIGANGSGKSSVLQAVWMCCHALSAAALARTPPEVQDRTLTWRDLPVTLADLCPPSEPPSPFVGSASGAEARARVALDFDESVPVRQVCLDVRPGAKSACRITLDCTVAGRPEVSTTGGADHLMITPGGPLAPLLPTTLYFPSAYGVRMEEPWVPDREFVAALYGGRQKLILRNMIARLDGPAIEGLNSYLAEVRGTTLIKPGPEPRDTEKPLSVNFVGPNGVFELLSAGDGLTNFITLYAAAALLRQGPAPGLLLLDEPELHLSPRIQGSVGSLLAEVAGHSGGQAVFVTHSIEMMLALRDRHGAAVYQMSGGNAVALDSQERTILALSEYQDLTPFETTSFLKHRRLLFVEGRTDSAILLRCAEVHFRDDTVRLERVRHWLIRPLTGVGNAGVAAVLAQMLTPQLIVFPHQREPMKIVNLLDRDYSREPSFKVNERVTHLELLDVVWSKHCIESQFLTAPCLASWLLAAIGSSAVERDDLEQLVVEAIGEADRDRDLIYDAHDGLRQVMLSRGKKLPDAIKDSRDAADADPATWQKGKDRAAFILQWVRERLPLPLQRRVSNSIAGLLDIGASAVPGGDPYAVPGEIRRVLDHMAMP